MTFPPPFPLVPFFFFSLFSPLCSSFYCSLSLSLFLSFSFYFACFFGQLANGTCKSPGVCNTCERQWIVRASFMHMYLHNGQVCCKAISNCDTCTDRKKKGLFKMIVSSFLFFFFSVLQHLYFIPCLFRDERFRLRLQKNRSFVVLRFLNDTIFYS